MKRKRPAFGTDFGYRASTLGVPLIRTGQEWTLLHRFDPGALRQNDGVTPRYEALNRYKPAVTNASSASWPQEVNDVVRRLKGYGEDPLLGQGVAALERGMYPAKKSASWPSSRCRSIRHCPNATPPTKA